MAGTATSGAVNVDLVTTWQQALKAVDENRLSEGHSMFWKMRDFSAKIWFNLSTIQLLQGNYSAADEMLAECLKRDEYLAVAYFQRGVIACYQGRLTEAKEFFHKAQNNVRNGNSIDYRQLGLAVCLTLQQIKHNLAAVQACCTQHRSATKMSPEELAVLPQCLFRPARALVDNLEKRNFLPKSKVISAVPEVTVENKSLLSGAKSSSAPTSPSNHRKQPTVCRQTQGTRTPPPSRPPPRRAPPTLPPPSLPSPQPPSSSSLPANPADGHRHGYKTQAGREAARRSGQMYDEHSDCAWVWAGRQSSTGLPLSASHQAPSRPCPPNPSSVPTPRPHLPASKSVTENALAANSSNGRGPHSIVSPFGGRNGETEDTTRVESQKIPSENISSSFSPFYSSSVDGKQAAIFLPSASGASGRSVSSRVKQLNHNLALGFGAKEKNCGDKKGSVFQSSSSSSACGQPGSRVEEKRSHIPLVLPNGNKANEAKQKPSRPPPPKLAH